MREEVDGPPFEHGIKGPHGELLRKLPARPKDRPDRDLLSQQFREFLSA